MVIMLIIVLGQGVGFFTVKRVGVGESVKKRKNRDKNLFSK